MTLVAVGFAGAGLVMLAIVVVALQHITQAVQALSVALHATVFDIERIHSENRKLTDKMVATLLSSTIKRETDGIRTQIGVEFGRRISALEDPEKPYEPTPQEFLNEMLAHQQVIDGAQAPNPKP